MILDYVAPRTLSEACALGREAGAVFLAGGTDVLVWEADGRRRLGRVVSLRDLSELRERRWDQDGSLYLGAGTTHDEVASDPEIQRKYPALAEGCRSVGSWSIRVAGTLGGNVCTAAPSADSAGPLLVYGAEVEVTDGESGHSLPLSEFYVGAGKTVLQQGQIVLGFRIPDPGPHGAAFIKLGRRRAMEIALVSATALVSVDEAGVCRNLRLALGTAAPTPMLVEGAAEMAAGRLLDDEVVDQIAKAAAAQARPRVGSFRSDPEYRRRMVAVVAERAVTAAWSRAQDERRAS